LCEHFNHSDRKDARAKHEQEIAILVFGPEKPYKTKEHTTHKHSHNNHCGHDGDQGQGGKIAK